MKKLLSILGFVIILLIIIGFVLYLFRTPLAEQILSSKLGTPVRLEKIDFNRAQILGKGFAMKNPAGFKYNYALEIQRADIRAPYRNYLKSVVLIDKIELSDIVVDIELPSGRSNNWQILMKAMGNNNGKQGAKNSGTTPKGNYAVIKLLVINNLTVRIIKADGTVQEKTIGRLEYKNIQTNEGDIGRRILQSVIFQMIFDVQNLVNIPLDITKDALKDTLAPVEKLNPFNWGK